MLRRWSPYIILALLTLALLPGAAQAAPTVTSLSIKEAAAYRCVTDAINCGSGGPGVGNVLYTIYYRINTSGSIPNTDYASQYFICRIQNASTGEILGQANISNQLGTRGFPEGVCGIYMDTEPVGAVEAVLAGTPSGFTTPPSAAESAIVYRTGAASFALNLAGNETSSIAAQLEIGAATGGTPADLIEAQPDGTIRFTDTGAAYFLAVIPRILEISPMLFQNFADYPDDIAIETPDNAYQTSLRSLWVGTVIGQGFDGVNGLIHAPAGSYWGSSIVVLLAMFAWAVYSLKQGHELAMTAAVAWVIMAFGGLLGMMQYIWPGLAAVGAGALLAAQFFRVKV